jgi:transcriptional regulator with XRE-family HTH domain
LGYFLEERAMDYTVLGKRIREERNMKRLSRSRLAKEVGLSTPFLGHVERGSRKASLETIVNIANRLEVPIDALLHGQSDIPAASAVYEAPKAKARPALNESVVQLCEDWDKWEKGKASS